MYQHQHLYGTMGLSKIYEIVLNSDPGLAFLLETNPEIANLLVAAHVFGHVDFFKNNELFAQTNRQMVNDAVAHALRIDQYIERYGPETVEHLMDNCFYLVVTLAGGFAKSVPPPDGIKVAHYFEWNKRMTFAT